MIKQASLFASWSALMAVSVGYAMQSPTMVSGSGPTIAKLTGRQGTVQFRQEGVSLWLDAGAQQSFQDGTLLATGADSTARVAFLDGREILLSPSSQVVLTL